MTYLIIQAPNVYSKQPRPWVFLAGSIEMGTAEHWQKIVADELSCDCTVLNPRRDDWDSSWKQSINHKKFREQVEWELRAQQDCDVIAMHFDPATKSPITILELGLFKEKVIVHCPVGFWKKGNVDVVCEWYKIQTVQTIDGLIQACKEAVE